MPAISPCEYELMTIESDQGVTIDLRLGVVSFQYFEDLFSPCITAQMLVVSSGGAVPTSSKEGQDLSLIHISEPTRPY